MLRHEYVVGDEVIEPEARRPAQYQVSSCFQLRHRHQIKPHVRMVFARAECQAADHDPLRVRKPRAPGPAAVEPIAAGHDRDGAGRRRRRGDAGGFVLAPDVVLRFFREKRHDAGVVGQIIQAPGRGSAGRFAEFDGDVEGHLVVVLVAAPALGLQRVDQTGVDKFLDRHKWNLAVALGFERPFAQFRCKRRARPTNSSAVGTMPGCGGRPQFGYAHVEFLPLSGRLRQRPQWNQAAQRTRPPFRCHHRERRKAAGSGI